MKLVKKENEEVTILHEENFVLWPEDLFSQYLTNNRWSEKIKFRKNYVVSSNEKFWHLIFRPYGTLIIYSIFFLPYFVPTGH